ncbi:MAG: T9SS type A sorting domain-containing protein, partial [Hymenobacter sp.]
SYIKGVTRADRNLVSGVTNKFGNIGLDITANHSPGNIFVFRVVGDPLTGPLAAGAVPNKRYYQIRGDDDSTKPGFTSSSINVVFHYLDSDDELNGIKESNLNLFTAQQNGAPFKRAYGTLDIVNNVVVRDVIASSNNFYLTLGDETNPLPVVLTAFTVTRTSTNALLTWQTASEQNNKGFEVQVSTDGVTYRTLTFVESNASNSVLTSDYQYLDTEAKKTGVRYYRLHQIDLDGTDSYSPVRTVNFTGSDVVASTLVASPNPFTDKLSFSLNGTTPVSGTAQVTLIDMAGRTVREQRIELSSASMNLGDLSGLRAGLYVAKIALPDGSAKTVRIQKQ